MDRPRFRVLVLGSAIALVAFACAKGGTTTAVVHQTEGSDNAADDAGDDEAVDADLVRPSNDEPTCDATGTGDGCASDQVCRVFDRDSGRCDGCSDCVKAGSECVTSAQCALDSQCYAGFCRVMCQLHHPTCDEGSCHDVGNISAGVCVAD